MSISVKPHHPLMEAVAKKLTGIQKVPLVESYKMIERACQAAVKWHEDNTPKWRPIEFLPKDGDLSLIRFKKTQEVCVGVFYQNKMCWIVQGDPHVRKYDEATHWLFVPYCMED